MCPPAGRAVAPGLASPAPHLTPHPCPLLGAARASPCLLVEGALPHFPCSPMAAERGPACSSCTTGLGGDGGRGGWGDVAKQRKAEANARYRAKKKVGAPTSRCVGRREPRRTPR